MEVEMWYAYIPTHRIRLLKSSIHIYIYILDLLEIHYIKKHPSVMSICIF